MAFKNSTIRGYTQRPDRKGTESAGYSEKTAYSQGHVTLKDPIERGLKVKLSKAEISIPAIVTLKDPIERGLKGKIAGNVESCAVVGYTQRPDRKGTERG